MTSFSVRSLQPECVVIKTMSGCRKREAYPGFAPRENSKKFQRVRPAPSLTGRSLHFCPGPDPDRDPFRGFILENAYGTVKRAIGGVCGQMPFVSGRTPAALLVTRSLSASP